MIRLAISADCHVTEPVDLWLRRLPARLRRRGPRVERRDDRACLVVEDRIVRKLPVSIASSEDPALEHPRESGWGAGDVAGRLAALDQDGVFAEVLYPNIAFFCAYEIRDPELQAETCAVYNGWVAETFASDDRFAPIGLAPTADVEAAVRTLEGFPDSGIRGGLIPAHDDERPYNDPAWEPLWEAAAGLGIPLSFHAGTGRSQTPFRGPGAAVANYVVTVSGPMETVSLLCASGVLERHPQLRVVMVECGAGWLAWTLDAMDDAYREHHFFVRPKLEALPSESFRRQGAVTFQRDPVGIANLDRTGAGCLLWGSDYPHPEGTFPESRAILESQFAEVAQPTCDAVVFRNAARLYGIPLPAGVD